MTKNSILFIALIFPAVLIAQIPNSGFEDWTNMITYNNPNLWFTLNGVTASANTFTCIKGTPGNPGNSYIKLTSKSVAGMGIKPGIAVSGKLNTTTMKPESGFPFTGRPEALTGNWEYMAYGTDKGYISILLSHWNSNSQKRDTVSYKYFTLSGMVMSWASFTIPISYQSESFPDSAIIVLSASNANGAATAANSFLYVDKLSFKNTIWLSKEEYTQQKVNIYPNPAASAVNIEMPWNSMEVDIEVYDTEGKLVISRKIFLDSGNIKLDIQDLLPGNYFIRLRTSMECLSGKFIKE